MSGVCLVVLDGWGLAEAGPGNAVSLAQTPVFDELWREYPHTTLSACGRAVGLPDGQMGNSEVGHLNLGAGAVVRQDLVRLDDAIADGSFASNPVLRAALEDVERVHLIGLVSDGGVHSSLEHLLALIACARQHPAAATGEQKDVIVHAFTDGRDTLPRAGAGYLARLEAIDGARVGSVVGRYWAMDRDRRWERTQRAYDLLVHARAPHTARTGEEAVRAAYERGQTDEFIDPTLVGADIARAADSAIKPGDSVIAFNFRPDRMRQITRALAEPGFAEIDRGGAEPVARYTTLTEYEEDWSYPVAFAPERPATTLAATVAQAGARQLHVAETEKYAHVTYFFNGGTEAPQPEERRELAPSRRDVPTYDHAPEMSAVQAADLFVRGWREDRPEFGIINFANADMVGHTGVIPAAVRAVETVDDCLGRVVAAVRESGGVCVITADHGNADHMLEPDGSPNTAHSLNPVPLILVGHDGGGEGLALRADGGVLADVAPTVLELLGIDRPAAMTGRSLIERHDGSQGGPRNRVDERSVS
jgi:2,3-bisphosphoglycerate-independent phosphoglycerate mutase